MTSFEQVSHPRTLCTVFSFCIRMKSRCFNAFLDKAGDRQTQEATSPVFWGSTLEREGQAQATPWHVPSSWWYFLDDMSWRRLPVLILHCSSLATNYFLLRNSTCSVTCHSSHWTELPTKQILLWYKLAEVLQPSLPHTLLKLTISYMAKLFTIAKKEIPISISFSVILLMFPSL